MPLVWWDTAGQERIAGDRRGRRRVEVELPLRYRSGRADGWGRTRNLSQGGLLMATDQPLRVGAELHVYIAWPIRLDGVQPLELVGKGRVVRSDKRGTAVKLGSLIFSKAPGEFAETRWASLAEPDETNCCLTVRAVKME